MQQVVVDAGIVPLDEDVSGLGVPFSEPLDMLPVLPGPRGLIHLVCRPVVVPLCFHQVPNRLNLRPYHSIAKEMPTAPHLVGQCEENL